MNAPDEPVIAVVIPLSIARRISDGLSDIALWCHGFNAALGPDDGDRRPWGTTAVTDINILLKSAIDGGGKK